MKPRYDRRGVLWFQFVLPSSSLRDLVYETLCKQYPELNYCCEWKDTHGYGLSLTVADWMIGQPYSSMYHVPPSFRPYQERPQFSDAEIRHAASVDGREWRSTLLFHKQTAFSK